MAEMRRMGLVEVAVLNAGSELGLRNLGGVIPGTSNREILLTAHYDSTPEGAGALDNSSGCAVVLAATHDLLRTPLHHRVRLVFFDGEEDQRRGSKIWLGQLASSERQKILASLNVEMVGLGRPLPGIVHLWSVRRDRGWTTTPAWLVHAVLTSGQAVDLPLTVLNSRWSAVAQLALRSGKVSLSADAESFLEQGVPAVLLSDVEIPVGDLLAADEDVAARLDADRLRKWSRVLAEVVRRLDGLSERPVDEDRYLVFLGRVWSRRSLYWMGFALWMVLVLRGLPGRWRGATPAQRQRRGRRYLPAFAFRMLFLASSFTVPEYAALLIFPLGLAGLLAGAGSVAVRRLLAAAATLPTVAFLSWLAAGMVAGWLTPHAGLWLPAAAVAATLSAFWGWVLDVQFPERAPG
jgi:hypothetical protein